MTARTIHPRSRCAFTLIELLVVIGIIFIAIAVILPAFGRLIESQNYAAAVNAVNATLGNARSLAVNTGRRTGVVFLWDAQAEKMTLLTVVLHSREAGTLTDRPASGRTEFCEVFAPARGTVLVELPTRIGVYGQSVFLPTGTDSSTRVSSSPETWRWYAGEVINGESGNRDDDIVPWIFPRNDPRIFTARAQGKDIGVDPWAVLLGDTSLGLSTADAVVAVRNATTFFVQFGEDGSVVQPRRSGGDDYIDAYLEFPDRPVDRSRPDDPPYDDPLRFDPENFGGVAAGNRQANPEVMLRPADQLAVVDLSRLADGVGIKRPWLARPQTSRAPRPAYLNEAGYFDNALVREVSRWIDLNAEIVSFNRYSGAVIRRSPL